jgi:hypothetical protein
VAKFFKLAKLFCDTNPLQQLLYALFFFSLQYVQDVGSLLGR